MSQSLRRDVVDFLKEYGAKRVTIEPGGKHPKVFFNFRGKDHSIVIPGTSSDHRALENQKADLRRLLGEPVAPELRKKRTLEELMPALSPVQGQRHDLRGRAPAVFGDIHNKPGTFIVLHKDALAIDPIYQRSSNEHNIARIVKNWSWPACGVLLVSKRGGTEKHFIFDGQHRWEAAKQIRDGSVEVLPCLAFEALTVADEARGFLSANTMRRPMYVAAQFNALLVTGDPFAKTVDSLVKQSGRKVSIQAGEGTVSCISEMMRCAKEDTAALRRIWPVVVDVAKGRILQGRLLKGIHSLERRMPKGQSLSDKRFEYKFDLVGYDGLLRSIRDISAIEGNSSQRVAATGVLRALNKGRGGKLIDLNIEMLG